MWTMNMWWWRYGDWDRPGRALNRDALSVVNNQRNHLEGGNENGNVVKATIYEGGLLQNILKELGWIHQGREERCCTHLAPQ